MREKPDGEVPILFELGEGPVVGGQEVGKSAAVGGAVRRAIVVAGCWIPFVSCFHNRYIFLQS